MATNPTTPTTRERILAYLQDHPNASVDGLSRAWGLTRADIRYHLNLLLQQGEIERIPRPTGQVAARGRPSQHYRRSIASIQNNFPALCAALLDLLLASPPVEGIQMALRRLAQNIAGSDPPAGSPIRRYNQMVALLNQQGYRARWEAGPSGPRVLFHNCPYAAILEDHPVLCAFDRALLEHLAQDTFSQAARINLLTGKPPACVFNRGRPEA